MSKKRVVVTGMSAITPLGNDWQSFSDALKAGTSAVRYMPEWEYVKELSTRLAAPVKEFELPKHYTRKKTRTMGLVSKYAVRSAELGLEQAGLLGHEALREGRCGVSYGSCTGSPDAMQDFTRLISDGDISGVNATTYLRMMSYTTAANISMFFGLRGRIVSTSTACTSGSQGIGYAYEAICSGKQDIMIAGGAEELCASEAVIFDTLYATSQLNDTPEQTPKPFDSERDGLVIGEGAGTLILEELEFAKARNAPIIAELVGYGTNSDGAHATQPARETMAEVMRLALEDAELEPSAIGYINAHGTATKLGDVEESQATESVFGSQVSISSLKGHIGHTLGACGVIEAWASINMMRDGWFTPTLNLEQLDVACGQLDYVRAPGKQLSTGYVMSNNFAFGGVNTSLIFKRWDA